jgi:hypothetical protein
MPTLNQFLSLNRTASDNDIKKTYKRAALIYHPDKTPALPQDERDQEKRQKYDATHLERPLQDRKKFLVLKDNSDILPAIAKANAGAYTSTTPAANNGTVSLALTTSQIKPEQDSKTRDA